MGERPVPRFSGPTAQAFWSNCAGIAESRPFGSASGQALRKEREGQATFGVAEGSEIKCLDHAALLRMENSWL